MSDLESIAVLVLCACAVILSAAGLRHLSRKGRR